MDGGAGRVPGSCPSGALIFPGVRRAELLPTPAAPGFRAVRTPLPYLYDLCFGGCESRDPVNPVFRVSPSTWQRFA